VRAKPVPPPPRSAARVRGSSHCYGPAMSAGHQPRFVAIGNKGRYRAALWKTPKFILKATGKDVVADVTLERYTKKRGWEMVEWGLHSREKYVTFRCADLQDAPILLHRYVWWVGQEGAVEFGGAKTRENWASFVAESLDPDFRREVCHPEDKRRRDSKGLWWRNCREELTFKHYSLNARHGTKRKLPG